ncbi:hypothetical protein SHKM778_24750 [Streptomyces sp. KM77-8]|uniref:DUF5709 domain-containing protein n=1 Tax=Streptomyces haneummycinicus TaxID=3074435 RepID=A0AAT9HFA6_9ACTN
MARDVLGADHTLDDQFVGDQPEDGAQVGQVLGEGQVDTVRVARHGEAGVDDEQQVGVAEGGEDSAEFGVEDA